MKLTKSLPVIKERNCNVSFVLDSRTQRRNATEFPLSLRFTIDRKFFYIAVGGTYSERHFSDICNANKSSSVNYKEQKKWREDFLPKYKTLLENLNKGDMLTYEMVRLAVLTGNSAITEIKIEKEDASFMGIWEDYIHHLFYDNNGKQFTTGESYQCAIKSFKTIMGEDCIKGFNIGVPELQKWKEGMLNGVKDKNGKLVGKISETTCGIYLRCCRTIWNRCVSMGFLVDAKYPFSNKEELGLVSIPKGKLRRKFHLNVQRMTELYKLFITKNYPKHWKKDYIERANHSLGLFLTQYLCNGFNMADAGRLTYDGYYFQTEGKALHFYRKKTETRSKDGSEVIVPIIEPLQIILDELAAPPACDEYVFPEILEGVQTEKHRRKRTSQVNANVRHHIIRICKDALGWNENIEPSNTWARHSFANNLRNTGVPLDYISESMGHSGSDHTVTQIYLDTYPLEKQMEYNAKLLNLKPISSDRAALIEKLTALSDEQLAKLLEGNKS